MSGHTHSLADWAAMVCMAASGYGAFSVFWFLFVDAKLTDFDFAGRLGALLIRLDADCRAIRSAAVDLAALLLLLTTRPKGAMAA